MQQQGNTTTCAPPTVKAALRHQLQPAVTAAAMALESRQSQLHCKSARRQLQQKQQLSLLPLAIGSTNSNRCQAPQRSHAAAVPAAAPAAFGTVAELRAALGLAAAAVAGVPYVVLHDEDDVEANAQQRDGKLGGVACRPAEQTET